MKISILCPAVLVFLCTAQVHGIILFGKDNAANQADPATGAPWGSVGRLSNTPGTTVGGSGIYLGNGYVLTANHVGPFGSVTFDGSTFHTHDGTAPVQVASTDMKIFRLTTTPSVAAVNIYDGDLELSASGTMVGWGIGRDPAVSVNTAEVSWGRASTAAKRWGTSTPRGVISDFSYSTYTFDALQTSLGSSLGLPAGTGENEASATRYDSGSGLFQNIGGTWYLTGLTAVVTQQSGGSTSTYGNDVAATTVPGSPTEITLSPGSGDINIFVRVSPYATEISALVPEPSSALFLAFASLTLCLRRRR